MFRKLVITAVAVGAGLFILNSTHFGSYARTAFGKVRTAAKRQVPLEFQLDTIRTELSQIAPDIRKHLSKIAQETVNVENLKEEITVVQAELDKKRDQIRTMRDDLKTSDVKVVYNDRTFSKERFATLLEKNVNAAKRCRDELEAKKTLLDAKERALDAARDQLNAMRFQKEQMEVEVERIEAELKTLRLAQTKSNFNLDDSVISGIKERIADIKNQLNVQKKEGELFAAFSDETILSQPKAKNAAQAVKEADEFLGGSSNEDGSKVASKTPKE